jgi:hypothetical protein
MRAVSQLDLASADHGAACSWWSFGGSTTTKITMYDLIYFIRRLHENVLLNGRVSEI